MTSLPKSDRDVLYQPLLVSGWYPIGVWNRALRTHCAHMSSSWRKHWAHKFVVQYTARNGRVVRRGRALTFAVSADHLSLLAKAPDCDTLSKLEAVIADHLKHFAFPRRAGGELRAGDALKTFSSRSHPPHCHPQA